MPLNKEATNKKILSYLTTRELFTTRAVSKSWNQFISSFTTEKVNRLIDAQPFQRDFINQLTQQQQSNLMMALSRGYISMKLVSNCSMLHLVHIASNNALAALSENLIDEQKLMNMAPCHLQDAFTDENLARMRFEQAYRKISGPSV